MDAINSLKKAVELNPNYSWNWYFLGYSYFHNDQYSEAAECFRKCLEIDPNNKNAREMFEDLQSVNLSGMKTLGNIIKNFFKR